MQTCKNPYSFAYLQELSPRAIKNLSIKICRRVGDFMVGTFQAGGDFVFQNTINDEIRTCV